MDSEPPQIVEAKLRGVNEPILLADRVHILPTITRGDRIREVNLQELGEERVSWGRWVNHWQMCQLDCPTSELQNLMLNGTIDRTIHGTRSIEGSINQELVAFWKKFKK